MNKNHSSHDAIVDDFLKEAEQYKNFVYEKNHTTLEKIRFHQFYQRVMEYFFEKPNSSDRRLQQIVNKYAGLHNSHLAIATTNGITNNKANSANVYPIAECPKCKEMCSLTYFNYKKLLSYSNDDLQNDIDYYNNMNNYSLFRKDSFTYKIRSGLEACMSFPTLFDLFTTPDRESRYDFFSYYERARKKPHFSSDLSVAIEFILLDLGDPYSEQARKKLKEYLEEKNTSPGKFFYYQCPSCCHGFKTIELENFVIKLLKRQAFNF